MTTKTMTIQEMALSWGATIDGDFISFGSFTELMDFAMHNYSRFTSENGDPADPFNIDGDIEGALNTKSNSLVFWGETSDRIVIHCHR